MVAEPWSDSVAEGLMVYRADFESPHFLAYYNEALDGNYNRVEPLDDTPDEAGWPRGGECGRRVSTEFLPTRVRWGGGRAKIPDYQCDRFRTVSARMRDIIERFEPGVHQFEPVDYINRKKVLLETRYHLVVCNRLDSMDHEHTTHVMRERPEMHGVVTRWWKSVRYLVEDGEAHLIPSNVDPTTESKFVFSRKQIGNCHLWREKFLLMNKAPYMSDELANALVAAGMTGFSPTLEESV